MKKLIRKFKQTSIFILAISLIGCTDDNVNFPKVTVGFTYTLSATTGTVTFINISENSTTYVWAFGDETSSTEINPIKTYVSGTYKVTLKAKNAAGASDTYEDTITISIPEAITLPVTFDNPNVAYDVASFNGASFEIVDNPDVSGTNSIASKVGAITNSGAAYEGINFDLGTALDLTTNKTITMNFWADAATTILLKLEQGTGADAEVTANHTGTGWETISFNFTSSSKYSRVTLFVDGPGTTAGTFYVDDIIQIGTPIATSGCAGTPVAATSLPLDFEGCETFPSSDNFGSGITSELTVNPSKTGINTSDFVLKVDKPTGSDFYAGIQNTFASNFDLTTTNVFKVKVYSTKANVVFRFELALNPQTVPVTGNPAPVFATIANANTWTEVEFTFTGLPGGPTAYNQLVIKPDNDQADSPITAGGTYYFDDLTLSSGSGGTPLTAPNTGAPIPTEAVANVVSVFSDTYTDIAGVNYNPDWGQSGVNDVNAAYNPGDGNLAIGSLNFNYQGMEFASQDLSVMEFMHVDVWTPDATDLKVTPIGGGETLVSLTPLTAGVWNSYDIPVSNFTAVNFGAVTQLKFDGQGGVNPSNIYVDNIYFYKTGSTVGGCSGTPIAATAFPVTFESCESFLSTFTGAGSITTDLAANPASTGINTSAFVLKVVKSSGASRWSGFQNPFPSNFDATKTFKVKVYSSKANVVMKFEVNSDPQDPGSGNPGPQYATITNANTWTEVFITFTGIPGNNTGLNQLVIKPDNPDGTDGTTTGSEEIYYFDDIRLE